ncbi:MULTISPECIES: amino acid ABC transporter permease [Methylobacterium]|jgi:polar amino acid transport system permease protein|uniref:Glutamate/aspartate import permease protein GltK n=2 Tax=Methylobacterium TaxID=407 RepID=A0A0C6EXB5_9HYPH|nr:MULTISPECIES: amino acid ABC transporter permease [Methylobacterium]MBK3394987.1 amino acid ABC transporter permease [Methylobacterium ajmalii]MBK3409776.1 amino acid ABC transporter permease [Methylobacterium ajmalii]MBK3426572.1 amino acid ABC transporter permease [Methylobacterium ajmalii]MBZ6414819.1 amino acid ABC transporter permease [Methylobacterium sp.]SFF24026.1 polar amino acid transport system permease protein [Methylobacterium sp. yr596]
MTYEWDFSFLLQYKGLIAIGALYTIGFTIVTAIAGFVVGGLIAVARLADARVVTLPLLAFIEIFRCTPVLVQLVWIYYALPIVIGVELKPATAAFIALTLYGASFFAEIIRGGIASIDTGQWDAGRALGMRRAALMRRVVLPQALKRMIPPLVNQVVLQLKNTSLLSVLAVPDLLYQGQLITSATYKPLEVYTMIAVIYFIILFPLTTLAHGLERRLAR